jgi:hypothetical protein
MVLLSTRSPIGQTTISKVGLQSQEHSHNDSGKASTSGVHNESHPRDQWGTGLIPMWQLSNPPGCWSRFVQVGWDGLVEVHIVQRTR